MKQKHLILCRSQSEAILLSKTLSACGVDAVLTRPPRSPSVRSCAWAVEIEEASAGSAARCLKQSRIPPETWRWGGTG